MKAFSVAEFAEQLSKNQNITILDTRKETIFTEGYIPGSIFIGMHSPRFGEWAGTLLDKKQDILLVASTDSVNDVSVLLQKAGFPEPLGWLDGGFEAWRNANRPIDMIINVDADELAMDIPFDETLLVLDVRNETEFADGHVKDAMLLPLEDFSDMASIAMIDENQTIYIHCKSGYRSVVAASLLKKEGLHNLRNVSGGWDAIIQEEKIEKEKDPKALN